MNKRRKIFNFLHDKDFDIILLQETHSTKMSEHQWKSEWGNQIVYSHGEKNARGVAIMFNKKLDYKLINTNRDHLVRIVKVRIKVDKNIFNIVNCYAPNTDDPEFFVNVFEPNWIPNHEYNIVAGDFNTILAKNDMKAGVINHHPRCTALINDVMVNQELTDIWRVRNEDKFIYTWMRSTPLVYKRLDYILISSTLQSNILKTEVNPAFASDHAIPWVQINIDEPNLRGKGYWKLNTTLLDNDHYVDLVKGIIDQYNHELTDPILKWEMIKMVTRGESIKFATRKKKSMDKTLQVLQKKLTDIIKY